MQLTRSGTGAPRCRVTVGDVDLVKSACPRRCEVRVTNCRRPGRGLAGRRHGSGAPACCDARPALASASSIVVRMSCWSPADASARSIVCWISPMAGAAPPPLKPAARRTSFAKRLKWNPGQWRQVHARRIDSTRALTSGECGRARLANVLQGAASAKSRVSWRNRKRDRRNTNQRMRPDWGSRSHFILASALCRCPRDYSLLAAIWPDGSVRIASLSLSAVRHRFSTAPQLDVAQALTVCKGRTSCVPR